MIIENELVPYLPSSLPLGPYLIFAPHPDDETLGMGGTIILAAKENIDVNIVFVTDGGKGGDPVLRKKEAKAAAEILGIKNIFYLNLQDREVASAPFPDDNVDKILNQVAPKTVFLPSFQETHPDHRATNSCLLSCFKKLIKSEFPFDLWFYEINRQGEINRLIDISSVLDIKEAAIECYTSQLEQLEYKEHALCLNYMRSITLDNKINYAEGFWCHDPIDKKISPEKYYFSRFLKYIPEIQNIAETDYELRFLRDKANNQSNSLLIFYNHTKTLAGYINDKINEIKKLKQENDGLIKLIQEYEKILSDISLAKSHRIASAYIKSAIKLRSSFQYLKNSLKDKLHDKLHDKLKDKLHDSSKDRLKDKFKKLFRNNKNPKPYPLTKIETTETARLTDSTDLTDSNRSNSDLPNIESSNSDLPNPDSSDLKLLNSNSSNSSNSNNSKQSHLAAVHIPNREEPILILYSDADFEGNFIIEHDIYLESQTYCDKKIQPIINNKPVGFYISCSKKNLSRIDLFMATYMRVNPGILRLSIYDSFKSADIQGERTIIEEPIRVSNLMSPAILDNRFISFNFEPISDSEGKHFYITLSLVDGIDDMFPGLWLNTSKKMNSIEKYHQWIEQREKPYFSNESFCSSLSIQHSPCIAIVIPVLTPFFSPHDNLKMFSETIESVLQQSYPQWRMIILDNLESDLNNFYSQYTQDHRVTINYDLKNSIYDYLSLISLNRYVEIADCGYFLVLNPLDTLAPHALEECINILNQFPDTDIIYSDEDKISEDGVRFDPFFKPDWSPDLLLSFMYMGNLILYKKELLQKSGAYFSIFETEQEKFKMLDQHNSRYSSLLGMYCQYDTLLGMYCQYDSLLRLTELTKNIQHIHRILYHKREILLENGEHNLRTIDEFNKSDDFNKELSIKAIKDAINRRCLDADVYEGETKNSFRVSYRFDQSKFVSIIIPFKDNYDILNTCIQSIVKKSNYLNYEIICVNNQSKNIEKFLEMDICGYGCINNFNSIYKKITIIDYDKPFNYSAINNFAVKHARGDVLLFLNSDTEVISENWLNAMLEHACRDNVGAVGAKLYYVNDTIQHAGIVVGIAGLAGHAFKHVGRYETNFYHGFPCMVRNVSAVTGACMMTRRSVFEEVGCFDEEHFKIIYNDLDLCLKMREKGYQIIYTPFAELYHYESYSRGYSFDPVATENIKAKWGNALELDPFYNPNLTIYKEDWSLE